MHIDDPTGQLIGLVEIVWINLVLSGDNAVVIALACRGLPAGTRRTGMALGAGVAVVLRIAFTLVVAALLSTPFVKLAGGALLLWIAARLLREDDGGADVPAADRLWTAVRTVAVADAVMSLDNVLAIAAVANGSMRLLVVGLAISIPLIVAGASLLIKLLDRFPILVWVGGLLLGWVAGEMMVSDPILVGRFGASTLRDATYPAAAAGAVIVLLVGWGQRRWGAGAGR